MIDSANARCLRAKLVWVQFMGLSEILLNPLITHYRLQIQVFLPVTLNYFLYLRLLIPSL